MAPLASPLFLAPSPLLRARPAQLLTSARRARRTAPRAAPPRAAMLQQLRRLFPWAAAPPGPIAPPARHEVLPAGPALPPGGWQPPLQEAMFGLGCFWGAERKFWSAPGVHTTSVGYAGGSSDNPRYRAVCSGRTGHAEVVNVVFDSSKTTYEDLLDVFWDAHDPTTRNRQGNDVGTQYRSAIFYYDDEQKRLAEETRGHFDKLLQAAGRKPIVTEIVPAPKYFFAEEYHQQYLHKNPMGYCGLGGTGLYRPREKSHSK